MKRYKITVVGMGYVGMSLAILLSPNHIVYAKDVVEKKVNAINAGKLLIHDDYVQVKSTNEYNIKATMDPIEAYTNADFIIIAVPTNLNTSMTALDTSIVETVLREIIEINEEAYIIIKSTVPIGFTNKMRKELHSNHILFSPEFLRESRTLYDNLHPSRIIVGADLAIEENKEMAMRFVEIMDDISEEEHNSNCIVGISEAEAIKLFSNEYLAMRVAYFNELDTYAATMRLDSKQIIEGVCLDPRIGNFYNNPSFGYGGYCLPKDTKQLLYNYKDVSERMIKSIVESNDTRKEFIVSEILKIVGYDCNYTYQGLPMGGENIVVGIFRLVMKSNSDNFRNSAVQDIIKMILEKGIKVIIYEPMIMGNTSFLGCPIIRDLERFKEKSTIILANRYDKCLDDVYDIVYSRDLFGKD